jgi:hypothetical protein
VEVQDRGRPVAGLKLVLAGYKDVNRSLTAATDGKGVALFQNVPRGSYHFRPHHDVQGLGGADIEVMPSRPSTAPVRLTWPSQAPLTVRSLKGVLRGPGYVPGEPQPAFSVELLEGLSGRSLDTAQTSESGQFSFTTAAKPGLYFLKLTQSNPGPSWDSINGLVIVAADPTAQANQLDLDLGLTTCGMWYADSNQCGQANLKVEQLSGEVTDQAGAPLRNATIRVFGPANKLVEWLRTGDAGKFTSTHSFDGASHFVVTALGFTPLRGTLQAQSSENAKPTAPLRLRLGLAGACGSADHP